MGRVVGIDLGTTNSCVAFLDGDKPVVIPNEEGARTTPSIVGFAATGDRLVGNIAKRQAITNPQHTVHAVKRLIGRKHADPQIKPHVDKSANQIVAADNGDAHLRLRDRDYAPAEISAMVLGKMKQIAEAFLSEPVDQAVITVPAYFDDAQRQATKDAGRIAGLEVLRIVNEPTAAALAYGTEVKQDEIIAVYDLGGGTFDISILELRSGVFEVRSTSGDTYLGGEDFDHRIIDHLAEPFLKEHGIDLRKDRLALQRLKEAAERAKHELSSSLETEVNLPFIAATAGGPLHLQTKLTRGKLETLVEELVERTLGPCSTALKDAGLTADQINQVILVGGQTRMPLVQARVEAFFHKKPSRRVDPDEVVAVGAAIQAGVIKGVLKEVLLLDVTPLSLGVETAGGVATKLVKKNTTIPTRAQEVFSTALDNQNFVEVHIVQGEREMAADNKSLARFQLLGIPPAARGVPQIQVTFDIDASGLVNVSARDLGTGKEQSARIVPTSGLSEAEIQQLIAEAAQHQGSDQKKRELAELRLQLEALVYTAERAVMEYGNQLAQADREGLAADISVAKRLQDEGSMEEIRQALVRLEASAQKIGEAMYASAAAEEKKP